MTMEGSTVTMVDAADAEHAEHDAKVKEFLDQLPTDVRERVSELQKLQTDHDNLESEFEKELDALERKYEKLYEPLYKERSKVVCGEKAVGSSEGESKGIPKFWLTAMSNNREIFARITERDEKALEYLRDVRWLRLDDSEGSHQSFKLEFEFAPNPFFTNEILTKSYFMDEDDDSVLERAVGTVIDWKEGHNLCEAVKVKKPKKSPRKGAKDSGEEEEDGACETFFNFFSPPEVPDADTEIEDYETAVELQEELEEHCELGIVFKEKFIPHAVAWYTGEVDESDDEEDEDDDDEDDDDDNDRRKSGA